MLHTGLWIKTMYAFENGFFPPRPPIPPQSEPCSHSGLSLTAIVSGTIKSRRERKNYSSTYHELSHRTHIYTRTQGRTKMHNTHQENRCDYWFLGWCARRCTNTEAWPQKVFLCFKSYNRSATPGQWLALYIDSRSSQLWNRQKCCIASIFGLIWAAHTCKTSCRASSLTWLWQ